MSRESCHACGEPIRVIQSAAYHLLKAKHCNDLYFFFFKLGLTLVCLSNVLCAARHEISVTLHYCTCFY